MKRAAVGGAHRGPVGLLRQRRTVRLMQVLLIVIAAALFLFAGYSWGERDGYQAGRRAGDLDAPRPPSAAQTFVLAVLGLGALAGAVLLQGQGGVRIPTPARLDELAGRAESVAVERAEEAAARPGER